MKQQKDYILLYTLGKFTNQNKRFILYICIAANKKNKKNKQNWSWEKKTKKEKEKYIHLRISYILTNQTIYAPYRVEWI